MKAISIKPPWIELIIQGKKWIETRTWRTDYRGPILLVSSKAADAVAESFFKGLYRPMPRGHALAVATLVSCRPMMPQHAWGGGALCPYDRELFSWVFDAVHSIEPFAVRGQLGLYEVDYGK